MPARGQKEFNMAPLKSERFELRLDEDGLARIDEWRRQQPDVPTRAEAMRRLVDVGLAQSSPESITFRPADKLIIALLCELFQHFKINRGINPDLVLEVLYGGHNWALKRQATPGMPAHLFHHEEDKEEDVAFVVDVLDMWDFIETAHQKLSKKEKDRIAADVDNPFGKHVKFRGFDSHHQSGESRLLHIARFMIEKLGNFKSIFGSRDLDSHLPMAAEYKRMYRVFEPIRSTLIGTSLSADQIIQILKAAN
jgi:uncharacterized protein YfbU (UPF0304 family)